jgi:uncharacterized protein YecE (DUF72 family)
LELGRRRDGLFQQPVSPARIKVTPEGVKASLIRIGVGGWTYEPWRGTFYPASLTPKRELEYASRKLTSIEIDGTYYRSQKPETFARWHDETPGDFVFALKAPRFITNRRVLADAGGPVERFFNGGVMELKDKLGPVNWQFMPAKSFDAKDVEAFLKLLPTTIEGKVIRHAVEVRHESFKTPDFVSMARDHGVAIVFAGDSEFPHIPDVTATFIYARIMGTREDEPNGYSPSALDKWATFARTAAGCPPREHKPIRQAKGTNEVFLYVVGGAKVRNPAAAMALISRLA